MIRVVLDTNILISALLSPNGARVRFCVDPDDDIFLECAVAASARYLVTGNLKHFPKMWEDVEIVTARQFLHLDL